MKMKHKPLMGVRWGVYNKPQMIQCGNWIKILSVNFFSKQLLQFLEVHKRRSAFSALQLSRWSDYIRVNSARGQTAWGTVWSLYLKNLRFGSSHQNLDFCSSICKWERLQYLISNVASGSKLLFWKCLCLYVDFYVRGTEQLFRVYCEQDSFFLLSLFWTNERWEGFKRIWLWFQI